MNFYIVISFEFSFSDLQCSLPHMLDGWDVEYVEGWNKDSLDANVNYRQSYEPVFVLRNNPDKRPPPHHTVGDEL